jgi:GNAT superfamily N-acetyltransferase
MIRLANQADQTALIGLLGDFAEEALAPLTTEHLTAAVTPLLRGSELGEIWVLEHEQNLIGYLVIGWGWGIESGGREALIDEVFVSHAHRNQGLGTQLVEAALARAKELDAKTVFLETEQSNPESRKLYQNLGFEIEDSVWMRKALG